MGRVKDQATPASDLDADEDHDPPMQPIKIYDATHAHEVMLTELAGDCGEVPGGLDIIRIQDRADPATRISLTGEELEGLALAVLRYGTRPRTCPACQAPIARCFFCPEPATAWVASDGLGGRDLHLCREHAGPFTCADDDEHQRWCKSWAPEVAFYEPNPDCKTCSGGDG